MHRPGHIKVKGQNNAETPQTVGKSWDAKTGGVGKPGGNRRHVGNAPPDMGAASKMPTKKLPSRSGVGYAPGKEKHGIHGTC